MRQNNLGLNEGKLSAYGMLVQDPRLIQIYFNEGQNELIVGLTTLENLAESLPVPQAMAMLIGYNLRYILHTDKSPRDARLILYKHKL